MLLSLLNLQSLLRRPDHEKKTVSFAFAGIVRHVASVVLVLVLIELRKQDGRDWKTGSKTGSITGLLSN